MGVGVNDKLYVLRKTDKQNTYNVEVDKPSEGGITPDIPTKTSELINDSGFITIEDVPSATIDYEELENKPKINNIELIGNKTAGQLGLQSNLVSGSNIKTINNQSLLGSGNIDIQGGSGTITDVQVDGSSVVTAGVAEIDLTGKVDKETGKGLSTNDYTTGEKNKLTGIEAGAEVNVQSDWNQSSSTADDYIKNKPSLATVATSGDYDDLTNKPTIPTVNNGTLTIQQNGTTLDTFTANQSGNTTVNITSGGGGGVSDVEVNGTSVVTGGVAQVIVPTATSDLTNDSGFVAENSNGDISITRNITAGGSISATAGVSAGGNIRAVGDVTALGDVEDGGGNVLSELRKVQNTYGVLTTLSSSLSLTTSAQKVPLNTFTGNNCSKSSNGIKVTSAGVYEVSGSAYFQAGFTANDLAHLQIRVGSTTVVESVKRLSNASPYEILVVPAIIVTLNANDVVYLYAYNQSGARGTVASYTGNGLVLKRIA